MPGDRSKGWRTFNAGACGRRSYKGTKKNPRLDLRRDTFNSQLERRGDLGKCQEAGRYSYKEEHFRRKMVSKKWKGISSFRGVKVAAMT